MAESANQGSDRRPRCVVAIAMAFSFLGIAAAETPPAAETPKSALDSTTVVGQRDRATVEREVGTFVNAVASSRAVNRWPAGSCKFHSVRWSRACRKTTPSTSCRAFQKSRPPPARRWRRNIVRANFYIVVTADPEGMIKAWSKRDVRMFGDEADQGGKRIREFYAASPVHVWYNPEFFELDGTPLGNNLEGREDLSARATRMEVNSYRALSSAIAIIDARRMKDVTFAQVAAYAAMVGLVEMHWQANVGDAPTILNLFAGAGKAPPGLTAWDEAFLRAVYATRITDKAQIAEIKITMVQDVAP